jgi:hypothetical protein
MTNPALFQYINPVADFSMTLLSFIKNIEESNNGDEDIEYACELLREGRFEEGLRILEEKRDNRAHMTQSNKQRLYAEYHA